VPVAFVSEDLTSWQADQLRKKVKLTDDLAAVLILQEFLDNR
jgi:RNase H-fold protein (predicted Holliday junction resolvase)